MPIIIKKTPLFSYIYFQILKQIVAFKEYDQDGSGKINVDELKQWCASHGYDSSDAEISAILAAVDLDGDGKIDAEEFIYGIVKALL